jgi:UDP-N-acetylmuramate dehydrogenase
MEESLRPLLELEGARARPDFPASRITTWGTGGPLFLLDVSTMNALLGAMRLIEECGAHMVVLGNGSDVLISDEGLSAVCVRLTGEFTSTYIEGESLVAGAGAGLPSIANLAAGDGLSGVEFLSGIPGTAGGAVATNAGAFGLSMARSLESVGTVDRGGLPTTFDSFEDRYREGLVPGGLVVTEVRVKLSRSDEAAVRDEISRMKKERSARQPSGERSAGSVFRNPQGMSAGKLIDECGLKGESVGGARVSRVHANFITSESETNSSDILELMKRIKESVLEKQGVELEPEVRLLGFERGAL